ncbi:MAG TPA: transglutaminase-like domain-containing protein [Burkholderiales bacterium]|nr:transglutaminase-like domain-containing protein [Burkholderiales bacterium]
MSLPPFIAGAALLFWGWHSGNLLVAAPLALALEAPRWLRLRFALGPPDYARIADLCTVFFVGLAVALAFDRGVAHGVIGAFRWLPVVLAPILLAQRLSEDNRVPLTALFRYLRKQKQRNPELQVPLVDTGGVFVVLCVVAAGVGNAATQTYYAGAVLLAAWALFATRPRHAPLAAWLMLFGAGVGLGYAGHVGMSQLQHYIGGLIADWHLQRAGSDLSRSVTDIGTLGRLKQRDTILARVTGAPRDVVRQRLLHRASYNAYIGTTWLGRRAQSEDLEGEEGGATWTLAEGARVGKIGLAVRVERRRTALPLPPDVTRLTGLAATGVTRNGLGLVQAAVEGDWIQFDAEFGRQIGHYEPPLPEDSALPHGERVAFMRIAEELGLPGLAPEQAVRRVMRHLSGYSYSLWRESPPPEGVTPLEDFMTRTKRGHCEYFASAAVILLRAAGVPARYATGYAVMEYSALEQAYVVRARHAHAWTRAWVSGRWIDLDPTPPDWFAEESSSLAPLWEKVLDFFRWAAYRWSQRGQFEASDAWWGVLAALVVILAWRLLRGKRVTRRGGAAPVAEREYPGRDSELYEALKPLPPREPGETLSAWLARVAPGRFDEALRLHQRYRFDPKGLSREERARLRVLCRDARAPGT